ncbi:MAG: class I SAM-dependent methyltransferase [Microscillaceae bacterium]|nr:class I SAM-dependent methyltransferase [Microscillaceae bacterium]
MRLLLKILSPIRDLIPKSLRDYYRYVRYSLFKNRSRFYGKSQQDIFTEIYQSNYWGDSESISGMGSNLEQTAAIRKELKILFEKFSITSILDIPCGDFNWMKEVDLQKIAYTGADIVEAIVHQNQEKYAQKAQIRFELLNLTEDSLPAVDLILCRDCLVHFSYEDFFKALQQIKTSQSKYLLTTTFTNPNRYNFDIQTGDWRVLNLEKAPFHFPKPIDLINEQCSEGNGAYSDKCLGLWRIDQL